MFKSIEWAITVYTSAGKAITLHTVDTLERCEAVVLKMSQWEQVVTCVSTSV